MGGRLIFSDQAWDDYWSRRITDEHRMVHVPRDDDIGIAALRYHYEMIGGVTGTCVVIER